MRSTRTWVLMMSLSGGLLGLAWVVGTLDVQADERTATPCEPGAFERSDHFLRHALAYQRELGLTPEQTGKLGEIHQAIKKDQIAWEADMRTIQGNIFPLLHDDKADLTAIEAKFKQIESLRTGALMTTVKATREAHAALTSEQRIKMLPCSSRSGSRADSAGREENGRSSKRLRPLRLDWSRSWPTLRS